MPTNLETAKLYLKALEQGVTGETLAAFYDSGVVQEEFPNRLIPTGASRDLPAVLAAAERGRQVMSGQSYTILGELAEGDRVVLEVQWTGTLAVPFGKAPVGGQLRARFAVFLDFRDGKIAAQRNYDCFDPWET